MRCRELGRNSRRRRVPIHRAKSILAAPVVLLTGLAVKLSSRVPVFYSQIRLGRGGRPFTIYKIRSMVHDCEKFSGAQWSLNGDPRVMPKNYVPQLPILDAVQECNGLGMGFTLFKLAMFKKIPKPWFKTVQENGKAFSQDLWFYNNAASYGFKFACDTRVKVGHYDFNSGIIW